MLNKKVEARKRRDSNPGLDGLQLLSKTIMLNKHTCIRSYIKVYKD